MSVNDDHPFGMSVAYPKFFEGERSEDDRLEWYATTTTKDIVLSAVVCIVVLGVCVVSKVVCGWIRA